MKSIFRILMIALLLSAPWRVLAADTATQFDLLKAMSVADYRATGLEKLSDAQVKALSVWIANYESQQAKNSGQAASAAPAAAPVAAVAAAKPLLPVSKSTVSSDTIVSRLAGPFTGWSGDTHFKLDNGQTWEQTDDSMLSIAAIPHPRITITKGMFNTYYLSVDGVNDTVQVQRIQP